MAPRKPKPTIAQRTPVAEWVAAAFGLLLTLALIAYTVWDGVTADRGPPRLTAVAQPAVATSGGFVVPVVIKNDSHATAAEVEVLAVLQKAGGPAEERRAHFAYVPGRGEARGGVVFSSDPGHGHVRATVESFADP